MFKKNDDTGMKFNKINTDLGILFFRLSGVLMLPHGIKKMLSGHDFIKQLLAEKGLPELLWIGVPLCEILAPLLILLGIFTRISALMLVFVMLFAIFLTHTQSLVAFTKTGALTLETNLFFIFTGIALFFTGGGRYSLYRPKNDLLK